MALGIEPDVAYVDQKIELGFNDSVLFYTDSITEAGGSNGHMYGPSRLSDLVARGPASVKGMVDYLINDLLAWSAPDRLVDDVTLFALRRSKP